MISSTRTGPEPVLEVVVANEPKAVRPVPDRAGPVDHPEPADDDRASTSGPPTPARVARATPSATGADIRHVQAQLGNADISTTQICTFVSVVKLQEVHAGTHPLNQAEHDESDDAQVEGPARRH